MTDAELVAAWRDETLRFSNAFDAAVQEREDAVPGASDERLAELLEVAVAIDCYYGTQCSFLSKAATEAAKRLRR